VMIYDLFPMHGAPNVRLISVGKIIAGYEYVPASITGSNDRLYVSSHNATSPYAGGITYYDFHSGSGPTTPYTYGVPSVFGFTEIELAKNGLLYFAYNPSYSSGFVSGAGNLYYFDPSLPSSSSPVQAASGGEVSTYYNWGYYIQRQIDGENYDVTDYSVSAAQWDIEGVIQPNWSTINNLYICDGVLMLNALINSYHTSFSIIVENGTITPPFYTFTASGTQFSPSPLTINGSATTNSTNLISSFPWLDTYTGAIRVTITVNGCSNVPSPMLFNVAGSTTTLANYKAIKLNSPGVPSDKNLQTTLPITSTMPSGSTLAAFRTSIDNAVGWYGANSTMGIRAIITYGTYQIKVYQVDPNTGERIVISSVSAPDLFTASGSGSASGNLDFNNFTVIFDPTAPPFYASGVAGDDVDYFRYFYTWACNNSQLSDYSSRVYCVDFEVTTPSPFNCVATNKSYFRIANNGICSGVNNGANARYSSDGEEGMNEELSKKVLLYPNPVMDRFEISIPFDWSEGDIVVTNSVGQVIIKQLIQSDKLSFDISKLASGVYIYHITIDGIKYDGKLIKN